MCLEKSANGGVLFVHVNHVNSYSDSTYSELWISDLQHNINYVAEAMAVGQEMQGMVQI